MIWIVGSYLLGGCHCKSGNWGGCNDVFRDGFIADWEISLVAMTLLRRLSLQKQESWLVQ